MGFDSKLRADTIVIHGSRYTYDDIGKLPHNISLENAKVIEVQDGHASQSKHASLSSLNEIEIEFNIRKHHGVMSMLSISQEQTKIINWKWQLVSSNQTHRGMQWT